MDNSMKVNMVYNGITVGTRTRGRPRLRWIDRVGILKNESVAYSSLGSHSGKLVRRNNVISITLRQVY